MAANVNRFVPGTDLGPLLAQLPGGQQLRMQPHHDRLTTVSGVLLA